MALDCDFIKVADTLEGIRWERWFDGLLHIRQPGPPVILHESAGYAWVAIPQQERRKRAWLPLRWILTKWRKSHGAWRLLDSFRISDGGVRGILGRLGEERLAEYQDLADVP